MTDIESEDVSRREQLRALVRVARYRPVFTTAIIGAGVFAAALEAVGLSFILPIVETVPLSRNSTVEAWGSKNWSVIPGIHLFDNSSVLTTSISD